jgi:hypothetical protein
VRLPLVRSNRNATEVSSSSDRDVRPSSRCSYRLVSHPCHRENRPPITVWAVSVDYLLPFRTDPKVRSVSRAGRYVFPASAIDWLSRAPKESLNSRCWALTLHLDPGRPFHASFSYALRSTTHTQRRLAANGIADLEQCHGGAVNTGYNSRDHTSCLVTEIHEGEPVQLATWLIRQLLTSPVTRRLPKLLSRREHPVEDEPPSPRMCPRCLPSPSSLIFPLAQVEERIMRRRLRRASAPRSPNFHSWSDDQAARPARLAEFSSERARPNGARRFLQLVGLSSTTTLLSDRLPHANMGSTLRRPRSTEAEREQVRGGNVEHSNPRSPGSESRLRIYPNLVGFGHAFVAARVHALTGVVGT